MSDETLSPGQQTLVDALRRLDTLDLGATEPTAVFRPTSWAGPAGPAFDLAAIAADTSTADLAPRHEATNRRCEPTRTSVAIPFRIHEQVIEIAIEDD